MSFQATTVTDALESIRRNKYVLPAIQREFVWGSDRICRLFDSLMQGFPIGTLLFWQVNPENSDKYRFYGFVRDFHERDNPHCPDLPLESNKELIAILDGQQRLTALNIGLQGSMAEKEPRKRWLNNRAFPQKFLYLNLTCPTNKDDEGEKYQFRFLANAPDDDNVWFPVSWILGMESGPPLHEWAQAQKLEKDRLTRAFSRLHTLHKMVHEKETLNFYVEKSQELDRVLQIFIRMNSGGMVLSYSDLLLSIATAQWENRDARKEVHDLVDNMNRIGEGFEFSKDFVLKAGLMLIDVSSVGFNVENFRKENMADLENKWDKVRDALLLTAKLAADFGFNSRNLRADSSLLPIAYYLFRRQVGEEYLQRVDYRQDRENIKAWLIRSLLKASGVWGSGLDTLLTELRDTLRTHGQVAFSYDAIMSRMAARGRVLSFTEEELEELVDIKYGDKRTFALLTLLYDFVDTRNNFHLDHVYPRSRFTEAKLRREDFDDESIASMLDKVDRAPNLQLLEGMPNQNKSDSMPLTWLNRHMPDGIARDDYTARHDLGGLTDDLTGFETFYHKRRATMLSRLRQLLGETKPTDQTTTGAADAVSPGTA